MNKFEAIELLDSLDDRGDIEADHGTADKALCDAIRDLGHGDLADAWERACDRCGFWYA